MALTDPRLLLLDPADTVLVVGIPFAGRETVVIDGAAVIVDGAVGRGHKVARRPIAVGEQVLKYGVSIGCATRPIAPGEHVHVHNLSSDYTATYVIA